MLMLCIMMGVALKRKELEVMLCGIAMESVLVEVISSMGPTGVLITKLKLNL